MITITTIDEELFVILKSLQDRGLQLIEQWIHAETCTQQDSTVRTTDLYRYIADYEMDSSKPLTDLLRIYILKKRVSWLHAALRNENLNRIIEITTNCDTAELFQAYKTRYKAPVVISAITLWHDSHPHNHRSPDALGSIKAILETLAKAGASINAPQLVEFFQTPIILAIRFQNLKLCELLIAMGADIECVWRKCYAEFPTLRYFSTLRWAAMRGPDFLQLLFDHNIEPMKCDDKTGVFATLRIAFCCRTSAILNKILDWYDIKNRPLGRQF